jgi:hypothetical protein
MKWKDNEPSIYVVDFTYHKNIDLLIFPGKKIMSFDNKDFQRNRNQPVSKTPKKQGSHMKGMNVYLELLVLSSKAK